MKKALILFGNEESTENLIQSAIYLRDRMGYTLSGIFISDLRRETIVPQGFDGVVFDSNRALITEEWINFEQEEIEAINEKIEEKKASITVEHEIGLVGETVREKMKSYDLLMVGKGAMVSDSLVEILKQNYKSLIIIGEEKLDFTNIFVANDEGIKINRSVYNFMNMFPEFKTAKLITVDNPEREKTLGQYMAGRGVETSENVLSDKKQVIDFFRENEEKGVLIMGNLSKSYFYERIAKKAGLQILEQTKLPVFIG